MYVYNNFIGQYSIEMLKYFVMYNNNNYKTILDNLRRYYNFKYPRYIQLFKSFIEI